MASQKVREREARKNRVTQQDPVTKAMGVRGFNPGRSQSRGGRSISVSFTLLPEQDERLSELAQQMCCSRSAVVRHLLETYDVEK